MEDTTEDAPEAIEIPPAQKEPSPEAPVVVSDGRRRGRRKVMKKKTIKDEEGYLGEKGQSLLISNVCDC